LQANLDRVRTLACWKGPVDIVALGGGITNQNYVVTDGGVRYVVRLGGDIPAHHVMRFNEHAASRAAAALGISPAVHHSEPDALVIRFVPSSTLKPDEVRDHLPAIVDLIRRCHRDMPSRLRGPAMSFWIFHVVRDYLHTLEEQRYDADLVALGEQARILEASVGPIDLVYGHNDLLAANFLNDGERLWLIDWDYAGFNSPLFDLGNLASNNQLSDENEKWLLEHYFERPLDAGLQAEYLAMKAASLLRETVWSMVSETTSTIDFDYAAYSRLNLDRYRAAWDDVRNA
jgi:thiamine kinase-like enzyme